MYKLGVFGSYNYLLSFMLANAEAQVSKLSKIPVPAVIFKSNWEVMGF